MHIVDSFSLIPLLSLRYVEGRMQRFLIWPAVAAAAAAAAGGGVVVRWHPKIRGKDGGWHIILQISLFRCRRRHTF